MEEYIYTERERERRSASMNPFHPSWLCSRCGEQRLLHQMCRAVIPAFLGCATHVSWRSCCNGRGRHRYMFRLAAKLLKCLLDLGCYQVAHALVGCVTEMCYSECCHRHELLRLTTRLDAKPIRLTGPPRLMTDFHGGLKASSLWGS